MLGLLMIHMIFIISPFSENVIDPRTAYTGFIDPSSTDTGYDVAEYVEDDRISLIFENGLHKAIV